MLGFPLSDQRFPLCSWSPFLPPLKNGRYKRLTMRGLLPEPARRPFLRGVAIPLALLCFFAGGMAAWADHDPFARSFDIVPVKLVADPSGGIALEGTRSLPPGSLHAAIALDFNLNILSLKLGDEKLGNLLPYRLDAHALFAYQLHRRLELALDCLHVLRGSVRA
ncbi:hypothetical protein STIAU_6204, partial [Stigmatella aurantiaca DW4/3-1]